MQARLPTDGDARTDAADSQHASVLDSEGGVFAALAESLQSRVQEAELQYVAVMLVWRLATSAHARQAMVHASVPALLWRLLCSLLSCVLATMPSSQADTATAADGASRSTQQESAAGAAPPAQQSACDAKSTQAADAPWTPERLVPAVSSADAALAVLNALTIFCIDPAARRCLLAEGAGSKGPILQPLWQLAALPDPVPHQARHLQQTSNGTTPPQHGKDATQAGDPASRVAAGCPDSAHVANNVVHPAALSPSGSTAAPSATPAAAAAANAADIADSKASLPYKEHPDEHELNAEHNDGSEHGKGNALEQRLSLSLEQSGKDCIQEPAEAERSQADSETPRQAARRLAATVLAMLLQRDAGARHAFCQSGAMALLAQQLRSPSLLVQHHAAAGLAAFSVPADAHSTVVLRSFAGAVDAESATLRLAEVMCQQLDSIAAGNIAFTEPGGVVTQRAAMLQTCAQALQYTAAAASAQAELLQGRDVLVELVGLAGHCSRCGAAAPCQVRLTAAQNIMAVSSTLHVGRCQLHKHHTGLCTSSVHVMCVAWLRKCTSQW